MKPFRTYIPTWGIRVIIAFSLLALALYLWSTNMWNGVRSLPDLPFGLERYTASALCALAALLCLRRRQPSGVKFIIGLVLSAAFLALGFKWNTVYHKLRYQLFFPEAPALSPDAVQLPETQEKLFVFTFDDGPDADRTATLLDLLKRENVHATFFIIGSNIEGNEEILRRELQEGHDVANHSWSHSFMPLHLPSTVRDDFMRCSDALEAATGVRPVFCRFPHGASSLVHVAAVHKSCGTRAVFWTNSSDDWLQDGDDKAIARVLNNLPEHGPVICLCHDKGLSVGSVEYLIHVLREKGYRFVSLSELLASGEQPRA